MTTADSQDERWEDRQLCSDESCIGVIGPDGRCKECGKPGLVPVPNPAAKPLGPPPESAATPQASPPEAPHTGADDWENRRLCPDESCIGVVGPDGRCSECGKSYPG